jgi:hypothetical protein
MRPSNSPGSLSKSFISALAFRGAPIELMQLVAVALKRMRSMKDAHEFWIVHPELRNLGGRPSFEADCPCEFPNLTRWPVDAPRLSPVQGTLHLICGLDQLTHNNSTYCTIRMDFTLNVPEVEIHEGSSEYHILATCAYIAESLIESNLLTREQAPDLWQLTAGAWETPALLSSKREVIPVFLSGLQPFGLSQMTEDGLRRAIEVRSWVTGCVKL